MTIENILWLGGGICYGIALVLILIVIGGASERPMATLNKARQRSIRRWKTFMVGLVLLIIGSFIATSALADEWKPAREQNPPYRYSEYHIYIELGAGYVFDGSNLGNDTDNIGEHDR